ncbi:unnamed protein product, partial [Adineta ricciae]
MEVYTEALAENSAIISTTNSSTKPPSLEQQPQIKQVRRLLLIFIGIDLVLCLANFLFVIHSYAATLIIVLLMYYGFGQLVT